MRLISSALALREVVALEAAPGATLSDLARATGASPSAAQRALEVLVADSLVERTEEARPRYHLRASQSAGYVRGLALAELPVAEVLSITAAASTAVEFVSLEGLAVTVVFTATSDSVKQAGAARFFDEIAERRGLEVAYVDHDDARRGVLADPRLRNRMRRATILHGDLDGSFPDRSRHGIAEGHHLHRPHRLVRIPTKRTLKGLAKKHRLGSIALFGSAVRSDFRPDSDLDMLVRYLPGERPSIGSWIGLEHDLETAFGRDVDLLREENLRSELRTRIETEAVQLI